MKVKAKELGFYGNKRRYEGDVFDISDDKHFSKRWMEKFAPGNEPAPSKPSQKTSDKDRMVI